MTKVEARRGKTENTVLVIDDEVLVRLAISRYLRECGFDVIEAADIDEAQLVLQEPGLPVQIVLCDVTMRTGTNGFAIAQWLRSHRPGLPIILAGSHSAAAEAAAALCEHGLLLAKPYEPQTLLERIKRLLAEGRSLLENLPADAANSPFMIN